MIDRGKFNLLGVGIDAVDYEAAVSRILLAAEQGRPYGVSALAVHGVMTGVMDDAHRYRLNQLEMLVPDGQPVRWGLNWLYRTALADRVYGPELMLRVCGEAAIRGLPIGFFGGQPDLLRALTGRLCNQFPGLSIACAIPSRFRQLTPSEKCGLIEEIRDSGTRLLLVGLGCPRQEVWAYEFKDALRMPVLAVGAAFNFHAGQLAQAPTWMQRRGLEWLFRLLAEPTRLWRRYLLLNPYFLSLLLAQRVGLRRFRMETKRRPQEEVLYG
jgi:N-acetylglucosaminyldiphosphoundecaprenol N-acetyl-beta-D-mannosaminyltransferase